MTVANASTVPVVDISAFISEDKKAYQERTAKELAKACTSNGFVGITGHGVSKEFLDLAFDLSRRLFGLPIGEKLKAPHPEGMIPHRGYSAVGREKGSAKGVVDATDEMAKEKLMKVVDYKESFEVGSEENKEQYNIWLPEETLPGFRSLITDVFWDLRATCSKILDALIMSVGFTPDEARYIQQIHTGHDDQLRLLHYPPMNRSLLNNEGQSRLGAHADWSSFTILFQDSHGGLEFADKITGDFIPATPVDGVLYLNIGDMFMRLTNGLYPSATHRVVAPKLTDPGAEATLPRYSIPYFVLPHPDAEIAPQKSCVSDGKRIYDPITYRGLAEEMFKATQIREE